MGLKDRFAESYARSKTMSGPEKRANDIIGKLILKKAIIPIAAIVIITIASSFVKGINGWIVFGVNIAIAVAAFFYIRNASKKYQTFVPYVGNLIKLEKTGKDSYTLLLKQGKKPIKLDVDHGGEDFEKVKRNQLVQVSYNPEGKIAILVKR